MPQRKPTKKQQFIGEFIQREMKDHNLPYGIGYLNKVAEVEAKAGKVWKQLKNHVPDVGEMVTFCRLL